MDKKIWLNSIITLLVFICGFLSFPPGNVLANPGAIPSVALSSPGDVFINESFSLDITFDNTGDASGFGPIIELIFPPEVIFSSASYLGMGIRSINIGQFPVSGQLIDPLTNEIVTGSQGHTLVVLEYPFGSYTVDQPPATATASCALTDNATLGVPVTILANPIFRFGEDPEENPGIDPPTHGTQASTIINPVVMKLTKAAPIHENETATGPNFPVTYILTLDVANGCITDNITVSEIIPSNLQFLNIVDDAGGTVINTPSTSTPGGILSVFFDSVTGILGADRVIRYRVYAPEFDALLASVLNPDTGASTTATDYADADGTYNTISVNSSDNHTLNLRSLAIQKGVALQTDPQGNGISPLDTLRYTINFQLSDYFAVQTIFVTDTVGDGQTFDTTYTPALSVTEAGTTTNANFSPANYSATHNANGTWTLIFNVSQQLVDSGAIDGNLKGGLYDNRSNNVGATTGTITFQTTIDIVYEDPANYPTGDEFINNCDTTGNSVVIDAELLHNSADVSEGSSASVTVVSPSLEKAIYAINGDTNYEVTNPQRRVGPGETVTYSLRTIIPTGTSENVTLTDYLPIPFFEATEVTTQDAQGDTPPTAGHWRVANDDTLTSFLGGSRPTLSTNPTENTLIFDYGTFDNAANTELIAHILFTVTATDEPMSDELYLTNLINLSCQKSTGELRAQDALIMLITMEPRLVITKGISATSGGGNISPPPATLPVDGDLAGADAGDTVTYVITMENQGSWPAYDVTLTEDTPSGFNNASLVSVTDGNGTGLAYTGDLFGGGLVLTNPLASNDGTDGPPYSTDTAIITYTFDVISNVYPGQEENLENTASITSYSSGSGGPNFIQEQSLYQDMAAVTITNPELSKAIVSSSENSTSGANLTIGEVATFRINVTLPEGQMTNLTIIDNLPTGLEYVSGSYSVDTAGFNGSLGTLNITAPGGSGGDVTFTFTGTTTVNADNNDSNNSFDLYLSAMVLNEVSNSGYPTATEKANRATLDWDENLGSALQSTLDVYIVEPHLIINKTFSPSTADGGQTVTVTLTVNNNGTSAAFDVVVTDNLTANAFDLASVAEGSTPSGFTFNYTSPTVNYNGGGRINIGETKTFTFTVKVRPDVVTGSTYPNTAIAGYTSLSDTSSEERDYTTSFTRNLSTRQGSMTKSVYATSEPNDTSSGNNVVIGEVITYQIQFTVPQGITNSVSIFDTLPTVSGTRAVEYIPDTSEISRSSSAITAAGFTFTAPVGSFEPITPTPPSTSTLTYTLGNVTNTDNTTGTNEIITVRFKGVVKNVAAVQRDALIRNRGQLRFVNFAGNTITVNSPYINSYVYAPALSITKDAVPLSAEGGDTITFTVVATNQNLSRSAPVFDLQITDPLSTNYQNLGVVSITPNGTGINITNNSTGTELDITIDRLDPVESVEIIYTAQLAPGVVYGSTVINTALLSGTSLPGDYGTADATPGDPGTETGERTGDGGVNDLRISDDSQVTVHVPSISKSIVNPQSRYAVGQAVTHMITIGVPTGTTDSVRISDNLTAGLSFISGSLIVIVPPGVTTGNSPAESAPFFTRTDPNINSIETLDFNFGNVTAAVAASITIEYQAIVDNILTNQSGTVLSNAATLFYADHISGNDVNGGTGTTDIMVGEPILTLNKEIISDTANLTAGDNVTYEITIGNTGQTTAYDVTFSDVVPAKLDNVGNVNVVSSFSPTPTASVVGNNITLSIFDLDVGQTVTLTFTARLTVAVISGETITNTGQASYSTADGDLGSLERTDTVDDDADFVVESQINMVKRLASEFPDSNFSIGEQVIHEIKIDIIQGTTQNVMLVDTLPTGLTYQQSQVISGNMGISYSSINYNIPSVVGQVITFTFGDISNPANASSTDDHVLVRIQSIVANILSNQDGTALENTADLSWTGGSLTDQLSINVVEPDLSITKDVDRSEVTLGDVCTFTIIVRHTPGSTADAYDISIVDTLPSHLTYVDGSCSLPALQVDTSGLPGQIMFTIPALTLVDGQTSFTFSCRLSNEAPLGEPLVNEAVLTYTSLSGTDGNERTGTDGPSGPNDYYATGQREITPILRTTITADKTVTDDNGGQLLGGEILTYNITLTNTSSPVTSVIFSDPIPEHTSYISGSLQTDKGTVDDSGDPLVVNVGAMNQNEVVQITFKVRVNWDVVSGTIISNQGTVDSDQTTPNLSDNDQDPQNGNDPTTIIASGPGTSPSITKIVKNQQDSYSPGQTVTYMISLGIPRGTTKALRCVDTLPSELTYMPGSLNVTVPNGTTTTNNPVEQTPFFVHNDPGIAQPETLSFDFGDVTTGSAAEITIIYKAKLDADTTATALSNSAFIRYTHSINGEYKSPSVTTTINITRKRVQPKPPTVRQPSPRTVSPNPACPPSFRVANLGITSYGQAHRICIDVINDGCMTGSYAAHLRINGKIEKLTTVSVPAHSVKNICWVVNKTTPGEYAVEVAGNRSQFNVPFNQTSIILIVFAIIALELLLLALVIALRRRAYRD